MPEGEGEKEKKKKKEEAVEEKVKTNSNNKTKQINKNKYTTNNRLWSENYNPLRSVYHSWKSALLTFRKLVIYDLDWDFFFFFF